MYIGEIDTILVIGLCKEWKNRTEARCRLIFQKIYLVRLCQVVAPKNRLKSFKFWPYVKKLESFDMTHFFSASVDHSSLS